MPTPLQQFIKDIPEPRKSHFEKLDAFIREHAPRLEPYLEGKFLGYGEYEYTYESGRSGTWFTVGLGNNKASIALYCSCNTDGRYLVETYAPRLNAKVGKSCINFKNFEDIDWEVLGEMLREANRLYQPKQVSA